MQKIHVANRFAGLVATFGFLNFLALIAGHETLVVSAQEKNSSVGALHGRQKVVAYVNNYGLDVSQNSGSIDVMVLSFLYPEVQGGTLGVKLGGALQGWKPPEQFSLSGSGYGAFQNRGGENFFAIGGEAFSTEDWRSMIGREQEFVNSVRAFCNGVEAHPDNSGVKITGIDLDYEDNAGIYNNPLEYDGIALMVKLSQLFKQAGFKVSHAPQGPYLCSPQDTSPQCVGITPGYLHVLKRGGAYIDYVFIQYYNNPSFNTPADAVRQMLELIQGFPFEGSTFQFPASKLFVGKPGAPTHAGSGFLEASKIGPEIFAPICRVTADVGGFMFWKFDNNVPFVDAVKKGILTACG